MQAFPLLIGLFAGLCLVALVFLLRWERAYFLQRGKHGSWLPVRLATVPIALVTAAAVIIPARGTSGMEGLAVFYILLFTLGPVFWFGAHWIVGKLVKPALGFGESAQIAGSPILLGVALSVLAHTLQPIAWSILRSTGTA
ncbi:hypothetical protein DFR24_1846 [Panacagrimonas perspica]|uniref:Uncharacterized protein n=1 Tax=Panacagrimonas perspica TaxID=381431 RepID=A0A4S3KAK5_9GAMM|nr:hypothetical protein [Panacagrimonas perspica]TDU32449.1 hypothetical protein DFR24_1846 [Panacagrimonas perspica]THD05367.1 hypothetical protein B1810_01110 [Panacagrimonas perspica]